jgi:glycosyltransferase involved in cell wall biosynthesis
MKASVIVLSWNGKEYLKDCLDAVLAQDYSDFEVALA